MTATVHRRASAAGPLSVPGWSRTLWWTGMLLTGVLLVAAGCSAPVADQPVVRRDADPGGFIGGTSLPKPHPMPRVTLTDTAGQDYNLASSPSRPVVLLFFGYINCPDVCRSVLSDLALALNRLEPGMRDHIQVIFITTDPARDNPAAIRTYLDRFDPSFIGLTGDLGTIKSAATRVGVDIEGTKRLPSGGYEVGHSAHVTGFDRERRGVVLWTPGTAIADLKHDFALLVEQSR